MTICLTKLVGRFPSFQIDSGHSTIDVITLRLIVNINVYKLISLTTTADEKDSQTKPKFENWKKNQTNFSKFVFFKRTMSARFAFSIIHISH